MNILVLGVRMLMFEPGTDHIGLPTLAEEPGGQLYQVFPGLITPFA
jgi:hypothetical protein